LEVSSRRGPGARTAFLQIGSSVPTGHPPLSHGIDNQSILVPSLIQIKQPPISDPLVRGFKLLL